MHSVNVGPFELPSLTAPGQFFLKMHPFATNWPPLFKIAPSYDEAVFIMNSQLFSVVLLSLLYIAPPSCQVMLSLKLQSMISGLQPFRFTIAAPEPSA